MTLVELMIAMTLSLLALAAVIAAYSATARHGALQLHSAHLRQQLYGMIHLISRDLRRAGYWQFDPSRLTPLDNPFQQADNRLRVAALRGEPVDSCALLAYDLDADGHVGVGQCPHGRCKVATDSDNVEQFGFRLRHQSLQMRYGGATFDCASGYWQSVNDPEVEITRLHFQLHQHCLNLADNTQPCHGTDAQLLQRVVRIDIGARLRHRPDTALQLTRWVTVRNDRLVSAAP